MRSVSEACNSLLNSSAKTVCVCVCACACQETGGGDRTNKHNTPVWQNMDISYCSSLFL